MTGVRLMPGVDDPDTYATRWDSRGRPWTALGEDGTCVYRVDGVGCSIHDRRPSMCRRFDCREWVNRDGMLTDAERNAAIRLLG